MSALPTIINTTTDQSEHLSTRDHNVFWDLRNLFFNTNDSIHYTWTFTRDDWVRNTFPHSLQPALRVAAHIRRELIEVTGSEQEADRDTIPITRRIVHCTPTPILRYFLESLVSIGTTESTTGITLTNWLIRLADQADLIHASGHAERKEQRRLRKRKAAAEKVKIEKRRKRSSKRERSPPSSHQRRYPHPSSSGESTESDQVEEKSSPEF